MRFMRLARPETIEEALALAKNRGNIVAGGMMWLHQTNQEANTVIDLSGLGLNRIEEREEGIRIGAYVTLRTAETSPVLNQYTQGAVRKALEPIVGVQFRNMATIGGSVFGRFAFSDVCALFSALDASVCLAGQGTVPMNQFLKNGAKGDLITHILLPKELPDRVVYLAQRKSATDFPVMMVALCRRGDRVSLSVGPTSKRSTQKVCRFSELPQFVRELPDELTFESDFFASGEYRKQLARVLLRRAADAMGG